MWDDVCGMWVAFFRHDRWTAPKFGTHVRIKTLTLKKFDPPHPRGGLGGYLLLNIFRDGPRPNLARYINTIIIYKYFYYLQIWHAI